MTVPVEAMLWLLGMNLTLIAALVRNSYNNTGLLNDMKYNTNRRIDRIEDHLKLPKLPNERLAG